MRALISVYDKSGIVEFAAGLSDLGWELVSSGGTASAIADAGIEVTSVEDVTGSPEMLDGRVKTLHPRIHGGILADRSKPEHMVRLAELDIAPIDLVVSNLYPFRSEPSVEQIDIGGPSMVRAAAKNFDAVAIVVDPSDYQPVLAELKASGSIGPDTRKRLARAAFAHTAAYDAAIVDWFDEGETLPPTIHLALERADNLRYGENPHQAGARYRPIGRTQWWDHVVQHEGLALSYLNLFDADAAWRLVHDLGQVHSGPAVAIIKHANPCGVSVAGSLAEAYTNAYDCDQRSAFGGVVALNRILDHATTDAIVEAAQADVVIAPGYEGGVIDRLRDRRKNTRVLEGPPPDNNAVDLRQISGGWLAQDPHHFASVQTNWRTVTSRQPTDSEMTDALLAWRVCGHVKGGTAWGIGAGQQNRVESGKIAAAKADGRAAGGACASDAFYPFPDGIEAAAEAGVSVVIQPGGAMGDDAVIAAADASGLAMIFTGERHFKH